MVRRQWRGKVLFDFLKKVQHHLERKERKNKLKRQKRKNGNVKKKMRTMKENDRMGKKGRKEMDRMKERNVKYNGKNVKGKMEKKDWTIN